MPQRTDRLREILKRKADAFFSLEGAVLAGKDAEAIHAMRVASRRFQEMLRLVLPETPATSRLIRAVRQARRLQSRVRDLDVMIARLMAMERSARGDARTALRWALDALGARRERRHARLADALKAMNLEGLRAAIDRRVVRWMTGSSGGGVDAALRLRARIADRQTAFQEAVSQARAGRSPDDFHAARVAGKRLRYLLEIADEFGAGPFKGRIARLRAIQQALGRWHDLDVLEETVAGLFADREMFRNRLPCVRAVCDRMAGWRRERGAHLREFLLLADGKAPAPGRGGLSGRARA